MSESNRIQAKALRREIADHYAGGRFLEAAAAARRLLELQRQFTGEMHPDYATGLSNLALILQKQDNRTGAESVLRQALSIRKVTLGEDHPSYQDNLKLLEEVRRSQAPGAGPTRLPALAEPARVDVAADPGRSVGLAEELAAHGEAVAALEEPLVQATHRLVTSGATLPELLLKQLAEARRDFLDLRARVLQRAEEEQVPTADDDPLDNLQALSRLLDRVSEAEAIRARAEQERRAALTVLDRVERLRHVNPEAHLMLDTCLAQARDLRRVIDDRPRLELAPGSESEALAPFSALLLLIAPDTGLSDEQWSSLHASVATAFGPPLAAAAGRGRLVLGEPSTP
jgi:tetratricopeptide (TPR) repeat protein